MTPWATIKARIVARRAAVDTLAAAGERPLLIPGRCGLRPIVLLVHRDCAAHRRGAWRLTRFDDEGPFGHTESRSWRAAVEEAAWEWAGRLEEARSPVDGDGVGL